MKNDIIKKTENLLYFSVMVLAAISAYTTAEGFMLVWNTNNFIGSVIAWAFALAVSSFLVFASLKVSEYIKQGKGTGLIFTFSLFALISMFFNFNSIYGKFITKDIYIEELKQLKVNLTGLEVNGIKSLDEFYSYSKWQKKVDSLAMKAEAEEKNVLRPGKWVRYQGLIDQKTNMASGFAQAKEKFEPVKNKIHFEVVKTTVLIDSILTSEKEKEYPEVLEKSFSKYNEIGTIVRNTNPSFKFDLAARVSNAGKPDFALQSLVSLLSGDNTLRSKEKVSIFLSIFLSFLLDFPLFFAIVILHRPNKKKKSVDIFGDSAASSPIEIHSRYKKINWD